MPSCLFNRSHGGAGRCAVASQAFLGELKQKGLGSSYAPLAAILADRDHLAKDAVVGDFAFTSPRSTARITAPAFLKPGGLRRLAVSAFAAGA